MEALKVKRVSDKAILPQRATEGSAGMDLSACLEEPVTIAPGERVRIPTGIAIGPVSYTHLVKVAFIPHHVIDQNKTILIPQEINDIRYNLDLVL